MLLLSSFRSRLHGFSEELRLRRASLPPRNLHRGCSGQTTTDWPHTPFLPLEEQLHQKGGWRAVRRGRGRRQSVGHQKPFLAPPRPARRVQSPVASCQLPYISILPLLLLVLSTHLHRRFPSLRCHHTDTSVLSI